MPTLSLSLILIVLLSAQVTYGPRIDFEKEYAHPTITAIGPFDLMPGRKPEVHIHIQYGAMQYVCGAKSDAEMRAHNLSVGAQVDILEHGKYLKIRSQGQRKWVKLELLHKGEKHNL